MIVQLTNAKIILFDLMAYTTFVLPYSNRLSDLLIVTALLKIAGPSANLVYLFAEPNFMISTTAIPNGQTQSWHYSWLPVWFTF